MTTLNKWNRPKILTKVMRHAFEQKFADLTQRRANLAFAVYERCIRPGAPNGAKAPWATLDQTQFMIAMGSDVFGFSLKGELLNHPKNWRGAFGYSTPSWIYAKAQKSFKAILPAGSPATFQCDGRFVKDVHDDHIDEYKALARDIEVLVDDYYKREREVRAILEGHRSVEKLLKAWPEVEPLLPEDMEKPLTNVPAPTDLNAALGLPV